MEKYFEELSAFLENKAGVMSQDVQERMAENPLAIYFSEDEDDMILAASAPKISKFHKKDSKKYFEAFKMYLDDLEIDYREDAGLFFTETFYTGVVWQLEDEEGKSIASGGRYDQLLTTL